MSTYNPDAVLADPLSHPVHVKYAEINIGIRDRGERWTKCLECGDPYQLTEQWTDGYACSTLCQQSLDDPLGWA